MPKQRPYTCSTHKRNGFYYRKLPASCPDSADDRMTCVIIDKTPRCPECGSEHVYQRRDSEWVECNTCGFDWKSGFVRAE